MKNIINAVIVAMALSVTGCMDFLDCPPRAVLSDSNVQGEQAIDGLVVAAYAYLANDYWNRPLNMWCFMEVGSDNAYKGGGSLSDQGTINNIEQHEAVLSNNGFYNNMWVFLYEAIGRCNTALVQLEKVSEDIYPMRKERIAEMKFLRAQFYWRLLVLMNDIVWVDETMSTEDIVAATNYDYTPAEIWNKIYQDCVEAYDVLPETQAERARPTRYAAAAAAAKMAFLSSTKLDQTTWAWQGVDAAKMQQVLQWTDVVIKSGKYRLYDDIGTNFYPEGDNGIESIWDIQYSHDDGTMYGRGNFSNGLNWPVKINGCDFYKPSVNLINAYRTKDGIPMFDDFNVHTKYDKDTFVPTDLGEVDPRVFHTIAMPTVAFKMVYDESVDNNNIYNYDWMRDPADYFIFSTLRQLMPTTSETICWIVPYLGCTLNQHEYRYNDILLMRAEALIETGAWQEAKELVNQIRTRAGQSVTYFQDPRFGVPVENCVARPYTDAEWSGEAFARRAVRFERRLETATEGLRFWDLIRWGEAETVLNKYYAEEQQYAPYLKNAKFDTGEDTFGPVPLTQITLSQGAYKQHGKY